MHFMSLSPSYLYLVLALIVLLLVGIVVTVELWYAIFPVCVTSASERVATSLYRFVLLVMVVCFVIVILHLLIGGGINAH